MSSLGPNQTLILSVPRKVLCDGDRVLQVEYGVPPSTCIHAEEGGSEGGKLSLPRHTTANSTRSVHGQGPTGHEDSISGLLDELEHEGVLPVCSPHARDDVHEVVDGLVVLASPVQRLALGQILPPSQRPSS